MQPDCSTRLVSRAEVAADPPALQLPVALTQRARDALRLLQPAGIAVSQLWVPERMPGKRESRASFGGKPCLAATCGDEVPRIFSPLVFQSPNPLRVIT